MKFVFLCDENYIKSDVKKFLDNFPSDHELEVVQGSDMLEKKLLPACDALISERSTWQKYFSLYRYFDLLDQIESVPVGLLAMSRNSSDKLKGRHRIREIAVPALGSTEDILSALDRLLANAREVTGLTPFKSIG